MAMSEDAVRAMSRIFVTREECERRTLQSERDRAELKADVRECRAKLKWLIGILSAIAVPVLAIAVKLLFAKP